VAAGLMHGEEREVRSGVLFWSSFVCVCVCVWGGGDWEVALR